jgi:hypothetical protein
MEIGLLGSWLNTARRLLQGPFVGMLAHSLPRLGRASSRRALLPGDRTAEDLLTTSLGKSFAAGTYTLSLAGTLGSPLSDVSLFTFFEGPQPVPEPSTFALGGAGFACAAWGMYRRRRRSTAQAMELPQQSPS